MRPSTRHPVFLIALGAALVAVVAVIVTAGPPVAAASDGATLLAWAAQDEPDTPMEALGPEVCAACHGEVVERFTGPHAGFASCADCHGGGTAHVEAGGTVATIRSFGARAGGTTTLAQAQACLACHGDDHPRFPASSHAAAGIGCADCHTVHGETAPGDSMLRQAAGPGSLIDRPMDALSLETRTCRECHGAVFSQFELAERHRLQEGILGCGSCHDPHQPTDRGLLAGAAQPGCVDCHGDKTGPFVFEHGSALVEGCVACHTPHGSTNRHMLKFQRTAELCYSCHPQVPGFHARFTLDTVCTNCHTSIHGSNFHAAFLE
jgi:predicted CXXCH cytochrome family protein